MTASSVASVKVEREQIEQLASALRVELRVSESGAALFRRCLDRANELSHPSAGRVRLVAFEAETDNESALEALGTFRRALGGLGDATEESRGAAAPDVN